jgi:hypothetical protein
MCVGQGLDIEHQVHDLNKDEQASCKSTKRERNVELGMGLGATRALSGPLCRVRSSSTNCVVTEGVTSRGPDYRQQKPPEIETRAGVTASIDFLG